MIIDRLNNWAQKKPKKIALTYNGESFNYVEFALLIEGVRQLLAARNPKPGSVAVIITENIFKAWLAILASRALALNTIVLPAVEMIGVLGIRNVGCVISTPEEAPRQLARIKLQTDSPIALIDDYFLKDSLSQSFESLSHLVAGRTYHCALTSGTTGASKKVPFFSDVEPLVVAALTKNFSLDQYSVFNRLNQAMTGANYKYSISGWSNGGCVIFDQRRNPFESVQSGRQTLILPHSTFHEFCARQPVRRIKNPMVKVTIGGGLSFDRVLLIKKYISSSIVGGYSSTEIILPQMQNALDRPDDVIWLKPLDPERMQVVDDHDREVGVGEQGILRTKLYDYDCQAYLDDPEATARVFRDGYFYPGDLAIKRADGRIRILGRVNDVLVAKTIKYPSAPIEKDFLSTFKTSDVYLFANRNEEGSDILYVVIEAAMSPPEKEMRAFFNQFPEFDEVRFVTFSAFPYTLSGKTDKARLRSLTLGQT